MATVISRLHIPTWERVLLHLCISEIMKSPLNLNYNESKILRILKEDSRRSAIEIGEMTGLNRNTVSRIIAGLLERGIIKNFTINIDSDEEDIMIIAEVENLLDVPQEFMVESIEISDGTFLVLLKKEAMYEKFPARSMKIVHKLSRYEENEIDFELYCDYCRKEILDAPIKLQTKGKTYYACCPNCKRSLENILHTTR